MNAALGNANQEVKLSKIAEALNQGFKAQKVPLECKLAAPG